MNGLACRMIDIDPKHLSQKVIDILGMILRIVFSSSSVTHPNVKIPIRSELNHPALVPVEWLSDGQNHDLRVWIAGVWACGRDVILANNRCSIRLARVIDKESSVCRIVRMERETQ